MITRDENHIYRRGGVPYISVTQYQTIAGWKDFSAVPEVVLEAKRIIGEYVDKAVELDAFDDLDHDSLDPQLRGYIKAFLSWKQNNSVEIWETKGILADANTRTAGEFDIVASTAAGTAIIDIKATAQREPAHLVQVSAYKDLYRKPIMAAVLNLGPNGKYHYDLARVEHGRAFNAIRSATWSALNLGIIPIGAKQSEHTYNLCKEIIEKGGFKR